jgi:signal transduction histidine kinase
MMTVVTYSWYVALQIDGLRKIQRELADRNRKDSLQLLRIQNDLNSLALAMRDMLDNDEPYPLTAWSAQFQRVHADLDDALRMEDQFAVGHHSQYQREYLGNSLGQFWDAVDRTFSLVKDRGPSEARAQIRLSLQARQQALSAAVARRLVENNESDEHTALYISRVYDHVQQQAYLFLAGTLTAILITSLYLTFANRQLFNKISLLARQRRELAQKLISTQESTLRYISRELHDEFGQVLTAIGAMLSRMHKQLPGESSLRPGLLEIRDITQSTLEKVRGLSQGLHPTILDETDLASTLDWYLPSLQRRTGMVIDFQTAGMCFQLDPSIQIHAYRVLQEALNNVLRHSGSLRAWVRLEYQVTALVLEIGDHGSGIRSELSSPRGIGLIAMRERAELSGGTIEFMKGTEGGTVVRLTIPKARAIVSDAEHLTPVADSKVCALP